MLALLRQHPEPPAPLTSYPTVVSPSYGHGAPVPTTPTAKIAMVHPSTDAPSPSHKDSDRPFQCHEPGCGRRFNRKFTLSEHIKTHTGEKPYVCPVASCSKRFSTSGNLARHKRLHASIKPFECTVDSCKRSFPNELKLQQHLKIHLGGKTHMCKAPGCGKSFSTAGNLTRHMKNHHSGAASSSRPQDLNQYRTAMAPTLHHHHSPVSVANSMYTSQHNRPQPSVMSAYAPMGAPPSQQMYHNPPPHLSQPSMANLYYSFNHTSTSAHEHIMNHGHSPQPHHDHHHHHSVGAPASYHQGPYHAPVYDDMPNVHPLQPHDGASSLNLFDDVIEFQLGHPRMM